MAELIKVLNIYVIVMVWTTSIIFFENNVFDEMYNKRKISIIVSIFCVIWSMMFLGLKEGKTLSFIFFLNSCIFYLQASMETVWEFQYW